MKLSQLKAIIIFFTIVYQFMNITRILTKIQDYFNGKVNTILMPFQPAITCLYSLSSCSCSPENHTKGVSSIRKRELLKERQLLHKSRVYCQHISSMAPEFSTEREKEGILNVVCKVYNPINDERNTDTIIVLLSQQNTFQESVFSMKPTKSHQ